MPHLRIEFSENLAVRFDPQRAIDLACEALAASGVFEPDAIKARVVPVQYFRLGSGAPQGFVHAGLALLPGRDTATKKRLTAALVEAVAAALAPGEMPVQITSEARDMDRDSYSKRLVTPG